MGLNNAAALILASILNKDQGPLDVLTIGRQEYLISFFMHQRIKKKFALNGRISEDFVEKYLKGLGVTHIDALDISDYQGAELIQDLNVPINNTHHNKYDLVLEFGTIEHIANIGQAMINLMALVKPGGLIVFVSPGNNFFGHGCYQISPEFYWTHLNKTNGYEIERLLIHTNGLMYGKWWEINNFQGRTQRVMLKSRRLVFVVCVARKNEYLVPKHDQQSDYLELWKQETQISALGQVYFKLPFIFRQALGVWPLPQVSRFRSKSLLIKLKVRNGKIQFLKKGQG